MRKYVLIFPISALLLIIGFLFNFHFTEKKLNDREQYEAFLNQHSFYKQKLNKEELKSLPKADRPDMAWQQDYILTMDPALKRPTPEVLISTYQETLQRLKNRKDAMLPGDSENEWKEHGPNNVGGRVRAIMFDPTDATVKKVWAGGVTGGLWFNNDITHKDSFWRKVDDFWDNIAISCIASDPIDPKVWYVGTGEGWNQSVSGAPGSGIWKTEDAGKNWIHLSSTSNYYYINDMKVRNENNEAVIYAAIDNSTHRFVVKPGSATRGIYRSTNGGQSFTRVSHVTSAADIEIAADNRLWVGSRSSDGAIYYSDNGTDWTTSISHSGSRRVEIAVAPSNADVLYALVEKSGAVEKIIKTTDGGENWTELSQPTDAAHTGSNWGRNQAWYDLIAVVDPTDADKLYAGTIDLFSYDGSNWKQLSIWYNSSSYPYVHADQHQLLFRPNKIGGNDNNRELIIGNDGGIFYSKNMHNNTPSFEHKVANLNITQFYAAAMHPDANNYYFLAGSQDNGTQNFDKDGINATRRVTGGDGAFCFIDQLNPTYQITSYVYNNFYYSTNGGNSFRDLSRESDNTGYFINPAAYDSKTKTLFSSYSDDEIQLIYNIIGNPEVSLLEVPLQSKATHIKVSPYSDKNSTIFIGTGSGRIFKVIGANTSNAQYEALNVSSLPNGAISCIDIGANEDELLVSFFNYGIASVWYSNNGGTTWQDKEGDLPNMPVRWCMFNPLERKEVVLATEIGVWGTFDISTNKPIWGPTNSGLANVRVDMLQSRSSDNMVIAATHGRGLFSSFGFLAGAPVIIQSPVSQQVCSGTEVTLNTAFGGKKPIEYQWYKDNQKISDANEASYTFVVNEQTEGSYTCEAVNELGTKLSEEADIKAFPMQTPDLGPDLFIRPEITLTITPGSGYRTYVWSGAINSFTEELKIKGTELGLGVHEIYVTVYSDDLCALTDTIVITVDEAASIQNPENSWSIYPNPAQNWLHVSKNALNHKFKIIDANGKVWKQGTLNTTNIELTLLPMGMYFIEITAANQKQMFTFAKN